MAEVTNLHRPPPPPAAPHPPPESDDHFYNQPNPFTFEFDPFSPPSNPSFLTDYSSPFDLGFDLNSPPHTYPYPDPNCFFFANDDDQIDDDDDDEHLNFVTDLFEPRRSHLTDDLIWDLDPNPGRADEPDHDFGFGPGLRVVGMDSDSDSSDVNLGFANRNNIVNNNDDGDVDVDGDNFVSFGVGSIERDEFEWEEVSERDNLNLLINGIEEISVESEGDGSSLGDDEEATEDERNLEWEVLLAVNNLESTFEFEYTEGNSGNAMNNEVSRINLPEDYILTMEYDALFGQLAENESAVKGSPPAAKSVVESLPSVVLTKEEIGESDGNGVVCAVCKDEFVVGEKGTKLPCGHLYHGDCILPWLGIRNTCPVCRHELPTDDEGYETRRRSERVGSGNNGSGLVDGFEVRYNFELLP